MKIILFVAIISGTIYGPNKVVIVTPTLGNIFDLKIYYLHPLLSPNHHCGGVRANTFSVEATVKISA